MRTSRPWSSHPRGRGAPSKPTAARCARSRCTEAVQGPAERRTLPPTSSAPPSKPPISLRSFIPQTLPDTRTTSAHAHSARAIEDPPAGRPALGTRRAGGVDCSAGKITRARDASWICVEHRTPDRRKVSVAYRGRWPVPPRGACAARRASGRHVCDVAAGERARARPDGAERSSRHRVDALGR